MKNHPFIFSEGSWIGEGNVSFNMSPEKIHFYTKWTVEKPKEGIILCKQLVEMPTLGESLNNVFYISDLEVETFVIKIENHLVGAVNGKGILNERTIAWEFQEVGKLHGFESYELQAEGDYLLHAEYCSNLDEYRTTIDGRIWKKS